MALRGQNPIGDAIFDDRLARIRQKHHISTPRRVSYRQVDATFVAEERAFTFGLRLRQAFTWLLYGAMCLTVLKAAALTSLGDDIYGRYMVRLQEGPVYAELASQILQIDPATTWVSDRLHQVKDWTL